MSTIQKQGDDIANIVAPSALTSGTPIRIGSLFGVPEASVDSGAMGALAVTGVHALPKSAVASVNFAVGDKVYWSGSLATATATDYLIGICVVDAGNTAATVQTRILGAVFDTVDADGIAAALGSGLGRAVKLTSTTMGTILDKFDATAAPTTAADTAAGYAVGSLWVDVTNDRGYICVDATNGAAIWLCTTPQVLTGTATIAASASSVVVTVGAAYNAKPVTVTVKSLSGGTGAFHATLPITFKAVVASGDLTITSLDAISAVATVVASNVILSYAIHGQ